MIDDKWEGHGTPLSGEFCRTGLVPRRKKANGPEGQQDIWGWLLASTYMHECKKCKHAQRTNLVPPHSLTSLHAHIPCSMQGFPFHLSDVLYHGQGSFVRCYHQSKSPLASPLSNVRWPVTVTQMDRLTSVFQSSPWLEEKRDLGGVRQRLCGWAWGCKYRRPEGKLTQAVEVWWSGARTTFKNHFASFSISRFGSSWS